jgi:hypothetical protein
VILYDGLLQLGFRLLVGWLEAAPRDMVLGVIEEVVEGEGD